MLIAFPGISPGSAYFKLGDWIKENAPGMYEKAKNFTPLENLQFLNGITGLSIDGSEEMEASCLKFLDCLRQMKADGELPD